MTSKIEVLKKVWRESASLLVLGRNALATQSRECNYKVLVMKRSKQTKFMPNSFVFPGGMIEKTDDSSDWTELYKQLGVTAEKFDEIKVVQSRRPFILQAKEEHEIARELSLRITAFRETFEELGLLLVKNRDQLMENKLFSTHYRDFDIPHWQNEVHNDSSKFFEFCKSQNLAPDFSSCYEWSAWLTPNNFKPRFETAFFLVALNDQPELFVEKTEVQEYMWETPSNLLKMFAANKIWLPPPQCYELLRLCHINDIDKVVEFSKSRNSKGITLQFPIYYTASDGVIFVYPGDDFYPTDPCYTHVIHDPDIFAEKTCKEIREMSKNLHRYENHSTKSSVLEFYMNIPPANGHLSPVVEGLFN